MKKNMYIYVFSYNRGVLLDNCMKSILKCANDFTVTIVDDQSNDEATINILNKYRDIGIRVVQPDDNNTKNYRVGGLHYNMNKVLNEAYKNGIKYVLFIQDDMQMIRPIKEKDINNIVNIFKNNDNTVQIMISFMKYKNNIRKISGYKKDVTKLSYKKSLNYEGYNSFTDTGVYDVRKTLKLLGHINRTERKNNELAKERGIQACVYAYPLTMWLPMPITYRSGRRSVVLKIIEKIGGAGFYPWEIMPEKQVNKLFNRNLDKYPIAEDYLVAKGLKNVLYYEYNGGVRLLKARGGIRRVIGATLQRLTKKY